MSPCYPVGSRRVNYVKKYVNATNEERRTGLWVQQTENIRGHVRNRHSVAVKQVMVTTFKTFELAW
jgi:hypothetical protein